MGQHGKHRTLVSLGAAALAGYLSTSVSSAAECRLALLLAFDISSSVDVVEDTLQREGLAAALMAPQVQNAFFGSEAPVALAAYEWSGWFNQKIILDWTMLEHPSDLFAASKIIQTSVRSYDAYPTAMGMALGFAADMMARAPDCVC